VNPKEEKGRAAVGRICRKGRFLSPEWNGEWVMESTALCTRPAHNTRCWPLVCRSEQWRRARYRRLSVSVHFTRRAGAPRQEFLHWQVSIIHKTVILHKTACANTTRIYDIKTKAMTQNKRHTSSTITQQERRQICTLDSSLEGCKWVKVYSSR